MATVTQNPVLIVAGKSIPVAQSGSISSGTIACVIYNSTQFTLLVQSAGGTRFLQPLQADSFPCNNAVPVPTVTPITTFTNGVLLGVLTAAFYDTNDGAPAGFPQPLNQYPGGSQLLVAGAMPPTDALAAGFSLSARPLNLREVTLAIPLNAGSITFTAWPIATATGPYTYQVVGNNSRTTYASLSTSSLLPLSQTPTVSLLGNIADTALIFQGASGAIGFSQLFAVPAPPLPTYATTSVQTSGSSATLLPALSSGSYYLFDCDMNNLAAGGAAAQLTLAGADIAYLGTNDETNGGPSTDHKIFSGPNGHRIGLGPLACTLSGVTVRLVLNYAIGP